MPTDGAAQHLQRECFKPEQFCPVGDVMYDVALQHGKRVQAGTGLMAQLGLPTKGNVLGTVHRAENTGHPERLVAIVDALIATAKQLPVVWLLHPRTRSVLNKSGKLDELGAKVHVIDPVGYLDMVQLEKFAALIATDSGGVQKEAFFFQVSCVTLRNETEWIELVKAGWNRLVPTVSISLILQILVSAMGSTRQQFNHYGYGDAAQRLIETLMT